MRCFASRVIKQNLIIIIDNKDTSQISVEHPVHFKLYYIFIVIIITIIIYALQVRNFSEFKFYSLGKPRRPWHCTIIFLRLLLRPLRNKRRKRAQQLFFIDCASANTYCA